MLVCVHEKDRESEWMCSCIFMRCLLENENWPVNERFTVFEVQRTTEQSMVAYVCMHVHATITILHIRTTVPDLFKCIFVIGSTV